ncbi:hypothetical protein MCERE10_03311 [Burkholderiaceae bacterium]
MAKKANVEKYKTVIDSSNVVHEQYKQYVDTYVHRANKELYAMLAEILRYAEGVLERSDKDAVILAMRKVLKETYTVKTTAKTGDLGVIVRLVLRKIHRKTIFTYKRVLQQAINNSISADGLADYIEANGGIDKLRVGEVERAEEEKNNVGNMHMGAFVAKLLADEGQQKLATFEIDEKLRARMHDAANRCKFRYMVCTHDGSKYNVVDILPMDSELEQTLLARLANYKAGLEYFMKDGEMQHYEKIKQEYAAENKLKAEVSRFAKAANDNKAAKDADAA